jgi:protein kinase-like protein
VSSPPEITALTGRFEVLGALGQGGMGTVYRARDLQAQREVALKVLLGGGQVPEERFRREGEITARLHHPGIVRVFSSGVAAGKPWLAYELVVGARSFNEALTSRELRERIELLRQAAEALEHAHAQGVVHRDVKPDNVLVDSEDRVRVTDFGLALGLDSERLTKTGAIVGTPYYMAPEQIRGEREEVGPATDVWALGVMLYEALTNALPFQGSSLIELATKISEASYEGPSSIAPLTPEPLARVCAGALQRRPEDRYPSAGAFAEDLGAWLEGRRVSSVVAAGPAPARSRLPIAIAVGGLALLGLGGVALQAGSAASPTPTESRALARASQPPETPQQALARIRREPSYARPPALRALLQRVPSGPVAGEAREELRQLGAKPLRVFSHAAKGLVYTYALVRPGGELITSSFGVAYRWRLEDPEPLETYSPASGLALVAGERAFIGRDLGQILELSSSTLEGGRTHELGSGGISRLACDAEARLLAVSQHTHLSLRQRRPDGSYAPPSFRLDCRFDISGLVMNEAGTLIAVCGGNRVDAKMVPCGFLWVLDREGRVLWKKDLPPRPETLTLIGETLYVGTTLGRVLRFDLEGNPRPDLVSPAESSTRGSETQFRSAGAHGSTLRDLRPVGARQVLSLSGGPGAGGEVSEVRLWEREGEAKPLRHLGRLEIRGVCGVSLAIDEERGTFYVGTRTGKIQAWSMEAVLGQRTYNAKANDGTGRRTRGS